VFVSEAAVCCVTFAPTTPKLTSPCAATTSAVSPSGDAGAAGAASADGDGTADAPDAAAQVAAGLLAVMKPTLAGLSARLVELQVGSTGQGSGQLGRRNATIYGPPPMYTAGGAIHADAKRCHPARRAGGRQQRLGQRQSGDGPHPRCAPARTLTDAHPRTCPPSPFSPTLCGRVRGQDCSAEAGHGSGGGGGGEGGGGERGVAYAGGGEGAGAQRQEGGGCECVFVAGVQVMQNAQGGGGEEANVASRWRARAWPVRGAENSGPTVPDQFGGRSVIDSVSTLCSGYQGYHILLPSHFAPHCLAINAAEPIVSAALFNTLSHTP